MAVYMKLTSRLIAHASFVIYTDVCIPMHRVHLLGGADATGGFNDTVVYYVAGDVEHEAKAGQRRRALGCVAYMTLLPDHFWSDSLHAPEQGQDLTCD